MEICIELFDKNFFENYGIFYFWCINSFGFLYGNILMKREVNKMNNNEKDPLLDELEERIAEELSCSRLMRNF